MSTTISPTIPLMNIQKRSALSMIRNATTPCAVISENNTIEFYTISPQEYKWLRKAKKIEEIHEEVMHEEEHWVWYTTVADLFIDLDN